jgi:hypothetical protein
MISGFRGRRMDPREQLTPRSARPSKAASVGMKSGSGSCGLGFTFPGRVWDWERIMSNTFGRDILIQAEDPMEAASFYVKELGFEITSETSNMISIRGTNINLFIE